MVEIRHELEPREKSGEMMHGLAEVAREEGRLLDSLVFAEEATVLYVGAGDIIGAAEVQSSRFLAFRHLYDQTGDESYKILAQHAVEASVDIIKKSGEKTGLAIPLYNLAKWYQTNEDYEASINTMRESLHAFNQASEDPQGLPSVRAEIGTRLASLEFRLGDDSAPDRFNSSLSELENNPHPDDYTQKVWLSGAYMHMAEALLARGENERAREFVGKAKAIIESDTRLKLRGAQIEKLSEKIN